MEEEGKFNVSVSNENEDARDRLFIDPENYLCDDKGVTI